MAETITSIAITEEAIVSKIYLIRGEQGVAQLSSVLNSETAVEVNIQIIRIFTRMRELLLTHKDILIKLEQMEKKMIKQGGKLQKHDQDIRLIFEYLKQLLNPPHEPRPRVGFRRKDEQD